MKYLLERRTLRTTVLPVARAGPIFQANMPYRESDNYEEHWTKFTYQWEVPWNDLALDITVTLPYYEGIADTTHAYAVRLMTSITEFIVIGLRIAQPK